MTRAIRINALPRSTCTLACLFAAVASIAAEAPANPHTVSQSAVSDGTCSACHRIPPSRPPPDSGRYLLPDLRAFSKGGVEMCTSCHEAGAVNHPVGVHPEFAVPADLPLDPEGRISCLTCHYIHGSLQADHPYCSSSLLDRLFNRERLSKSFLLRRENAQGELCRACHGPDKT